MKKLIFLLSIFGFTGSFFSQEFERSWGTYYGPAGTDLGNSGYTKPKFDSSNNLNFLGAINTSSSYSSSYYNQFATSGTGYNIGNNVNVLSAVINPNGSILNTTYIGDISAFESPIYSINDLGDRFGYQYSSTGISNSGTLGTWFPNSVAAGANFHMLSKYNSAGVLQWKTFLPSEFSAIINEIVHDSSGNTYITGTTLNQNIGTPGSFQSSFIPRYSGNGTLLPNPYIAKLNSNGQLVWASYFPAGVLKMRYHNNNLYITSGDDLDPALSQMASPSAFQNQKAGVSLTKLDANDGSRMWGTYYGPVGGTFVNLSSGLDVNETGVYLLGDIYDFAGTGNSYFGTSGAFQTSSQGIIGNADMYLTKFNLDGGRVWSTYIATASEDMSSYNSNPLVVSGNNIFICGIQQVPPNSSAPANLATPGAHISSPPTFSGTVNTAYNNLFFSKFNSSGTREWSSYYGGAGAHLGLPPTINITVFDSDNFYIYGSTAATTGISTEGAAQPTAVNGILNGYLAKFTKKNLSINETSLAQNLSLYDNPNNGLFTISGDVLAKKSFTLAIYDMSGRLLFTENMSKDSKQTFNYQGKLQTGNYSLKVSSGKDFSKTFKMIVK